MGITLFTKYQDMKLLKQHAHNLKRLIKLQLTISQKINKRTIIIKLYRFKIKTHRSQGKNQFKQRSKMSIESRLLNYEHELTNIIALYETYITRVDSHYITHEEIKQKGERFLQWVNQQLAFKVQKINQISQHSITIFRELQQEELQMSAKLLQLQHQNNQKNIIIENNMETIKTIEEKLHERENEIYKLKHQITQLTQKIQKEQTRFKRQAKELKKTFREIQENTENERQVFDNIQLQYEYQKDQNDQLKNSLSLLNEQLQDLKKDLEEAQRLLIVSENKLEWEVKKKIALEDLVKEKDQMIQKLLAEINDFKDTLHDPYHKIQENRLEEHEIDDFHLNHLNKLQKNNNLSEEMAFRQSFTSEIGNYDPFMRKNSMRKSFDDGVPQQLSQNHLEFLPNENERHKQFQKQDKAINPTKNNFQNQTNSKEQIKQKPKTNDRPFVHKRQFSVQEIPTRTATQHMTSQEQLQQKKNLPSESLQQISNKNFDLQQEKKLQKITQKVESDSQSLGNIYRCGHDLYFAHFLLTSQSVKIKEDCEEMLNIDVKQYYQEIIDKRIPMHVWDDWIKDKLRIALKAIKDSYDLQSKKSNGNVRN